MAATEILQQAGPAAPDAKGLIGETIKGRYRLVSVVGEGGMGAVYAAEHVEIGRRVAVKLVHAVHAKNPQIALRLKQEARATSAIESDHVVQVLDAGEDEEHGLFVVMELLAGEDLEARLARERRLPAAEALRIADQAARGLARAHARGIIHRDLKPANVFLCVREDGPPAVKLVDFGIAKLVRDAARDGLGQRFTMSGCVVGTPQYMSPEQAQGLATIDARTDVYSLGALLFEMLAGEPPVPELENYEQKILHLVTKPRPRLRDVLPGVDPALDVLVSDLMAFDPNARPADMSAHKAGRFTEALAAFQEANRLAPRESAQRNVAQTHRDLLDYAAAHAAYDALLAKYGATMKRADKANAERARAELATLTGVVAVTVPAPDARVVVDGKDVGAPPVTVRLNPGAHEVTVTREGFEPLERAFEIAGRDEVTVAGPLTKPLTTPAETGHVEVTVAPEEPRATVRVDGDVVGAAPWRGDLEPGRHRVEAESELGAVAATVDVTRGGDHVLALTLVRPTPAPRVIVLTPPSEAPAYDPWRGLYTRVELAGLFALGHHDTVEDRSAYGAGVPTEGSGLYGGGVGLRVGYSLGPIGIEGALLLAYDHSSVKVDVDASRKDVWTFHRPGGTLAVGARWIPELAPVRPTAGLALGLSGRSMGVTRAVEDTNVRDRVDFELYMTPTLVLDGGVMIGNTPGGKLFAGVQMLVDLPSRQVQPSANAKDGRFPIPPAAEIATSTGPEVFLGPVVGLVLGH
ncbi:MAG: serine/threonine protein kinase [Labilithrix sp.]|nr:serine/threonine protein kinase [Labilithrix sp.]MCW5817624.1 serine/threonine protein kinase [Labilithrix sp.]